MNKTDAIQHIRSVNRICQGKTLLDFDQRVSFFKRWRNLVIDRVNFVEGVSMQLELCSLLRKAYVAVEFGNFESLAKEVFKLIDSREGCGADFNDELIKHPFDGQDRKADCYKCGVTTFFTSPFYEINE